MPFPDFVVHFPRICQNRHQHRFLAMVVNRGDKHANTYSKTKEHKTRVLARILQTCSSVRLFLGTVLLCAKHQRAHKFTMTMPTSRCLAGNVYSVLLAF